MNPDSIRIEIFCVHSADAINPDSIRIEMLVRTHLYAAGLTFARSTFTRGGPPGSKRPVT